MVKCTATIIIEPRLLVREALHSLIKNYPYRVVCTVASTADIGSRSMVGDAKLVILGAQSADRLLTSANCGPIARSFCCSNTLPSPIFRSC